MVQSNSHCRTFEGSNYFRQRLVLATLSRTTIKIKNIRVRDDAPGLREYEAGVLRLLDKLINGSVIEINATGTSVYFQPGVLCGGDIEHDCSLQRGIGYYLEMLVCLAPFCKKSVTAILKGITSESNDPSVDAIKFSTFPLLKRLLGDDDRIKLVINKRGSSPDGGGHVTFGCPVKPKLLPIQYTDPGKVKRIRGIAWTCRTSPAMANRMVDAARGVLNQFLTDIYIHTDHGSPSCTGMSPGFGITLWAETIHGSVYLAETCSEPKSSILRDFKPSVPEDLGKKAAFLLLEEISRGGCVDSTNQSIAALLMVLGQTDVSKLEVGPLTPYTVPSKYQRVFSSDVQADTLSEVRL
ncbi:RNA 3'-terminal phosphate cyclase-like protein isoform X2 [Watersipora subatra]|uniref:RNA 3'-terminal phosphate cyclase-like protein isoform X2 n=1 Tax=Watersipora subatra TaxID=2589382 RepID=UPI00355BC116